MAEVNAFSIDGTKYQLTATDQTYVGETGLAQLGLDYDSPPEDCEDALADAGGGRLIISGADVTDDGWAMDDIANGRSVILDMLCTPRPDDNGHMCSLMAYGVTHDYGTYQRAHGETGDWDTGWTTLVYGVGDTWSPGTTVTCIGRAGSASSDYVQVSVPLCAPVAPGVSSATCTSAGTVHICWSDTSADLTTASTSHVSVQGVGNGHIFLRITDVSDLGDFDVYNTAYVSLNSNFAIKFS